MSNLVTIPYYQGALSVDDLSNLLAVKIFLPFTNDLLDKSPNPQVVTNTGGVTIGPDGALFGAGKQLSVPFTSDGDYCVEVILKITKNNNYQNVIVFGTQGTPHLLIHPNDAIALQAYGSGDLTINCGEYTNYFGKETHLCVVRKNNYFYIYINGLLVGSGTGIITNGTSIQLSGYIDSGKSYALNGSCGGVKVTKKALEPSQFSLLRPMNILYPTFKVGNKEYIFKAGILNPKFTTSIVGSVVMNSSSIRVNGAGKITFGGTVKGNVFARIRLVGTTQGSVYLQSIKDAVVSTFIALTSNSYNLTDLILGTYFDNNSFLIQSAENSPVFDILEIWIE
ncbi:MAG: LamG-like jellyroll fold domain-containing protein [Longicatena sp.]